MSRLIIRAISASTLLFLCISFNVAAAKITNLMEAVNVANQQTILGYRILKNYSQKGQDVRFLDASDEADALPALFKANLAALTGFKSHPLLADIEAQYTAIEEMLVEAPIDKATASVLYGKVTQLTRDTQKLADNLIQQDAVKVKMVNIAGKQGIYASQLSSFYLLLSWDITTSEVAPLYEQALIDFEENLDNLTHAAVTTPEVVSIMEGVLKKWRSFYSLDKVLSGKPTPVTAVRFMGKVEKHSASISNIYLQM